MMQYLPFTVQHAFAGLWPLVGHWGIQVGVIIICLGGEVVLAMFKAQLPPFISDSLRPIQTALLFIAVAAGISLYSFSDGVKVEHARAVAQQKVLLNQVGTVVDDVLTAPENQPQPEKKGVPRKPPVDRWDSPEN